MSQTSTSEPPILAKAVGVSEEEIQGTTLQPYRAKSDEALIKRQQVKALTTSTISESSDQTSSALWTPAQALAKQPPKHTIFSRSHRKGEKSKRRLYKDETATGSEETSAFLTQHGHKNNRAEGKELCSFERDYHYHRNNSSSKRKSRSNSQRNTTRRSNKQHQELYNDYTRYQYHRRSRRDKHRRHKSRLPKADTPPSTTSGFPKIIQRLKDFFFGKKTPEEEHHYHHSKPFKEHKKKHTREYSMSKKREPSGKLFRSASDSDLEIVKHRHRRILHKNSREARDDWFKTGKHWRTKRHEHKLSSIGETSDRSGRLELTSAGDAGKLVHSRGGKTTHDDFPRHKNGDIRRLNSHGKKEEKDSSDGSHSSHSHRRHRRRSKEYQSLRKKWAKQHQGFEHDMEKLEKLVKLIGIKKTENWLEQKNSDNKTLLERLEATQEKCVAEVDFTRHVLICKLQRLENKLEESLSTIDYNNNKNTLTDQNGRSIDEIKDEMSRECRDLRKLLQETSSQLKQVLDEKSSLGQHENDDILEGCTSPVPKDLNRRCRSANDILESRDVPSPQLSRQSRHTGSFRHSEPESTRMERKEKHQEKRTRVTTYV